MRITLTRKYDGYTPQTALPMSQVKLTYMHWERLPEFVVDASGRVYRQDYVVMHELGTTDPVYIRGRITLLPRGTTTTREEWYGYAVYGGGL